VFSELYDSWYLAVSDVTTVQYRVVISNALSCFASFIIFSAREHICLAHYMLSPVRPSVRRVIIQKRLKLGL